MLGLRSPRRRSRDLDDLFIRAVRPEFPILVSHQQLPDEISFEVPHLLLQSTAARLALSAAGATIEVRFYGDYVESAERCIEYLRRKTLAVLDGWKSTEEYPSFVGLIVTANYSFESLGESPVQRLLSRHVNITVAPEHAQDVLVRVGWRVLDKYFATVTVSSYEEKTLQRPIFPGQSSLQLKPWEGDISDRGVSLAIDVNNKLSAIASRSDPVVAAADVDALTGLLATIVEMGDALVESGQVDSERLASQLAR